MIGINPQHEFVYVGAHLDIYHANKGEGIPKHQHTFGHATICHNGSCSIKIKGKEKIINKHSGAFDLPANEWHEIEALEDGTVFVNVFAEGKY
jgi:quercetin dioxygenase-like cupin family protein